MPFRRASRSRSLREISTSSSWRSAAGSARTPRATGTSVNRRSLAVEPMTCPPNAFRTGAGVLVLEPGESTTAVWGISYER
jgi:galactose mutarotase-like enzyme